MTNLHSSAATLDKKMAKMALERAELRQVVSGAQLLVAETKLESTRAR